MFVKKKDFKNLRKVVDNYGKCEKCGCLLEKDTSYKGKAEVRKKLALGWCHGYSAEYKDYIYYPYYCEIHKPKDKPSITSKKKQ